MSSLPLSMINSLILILDVDKHTNQIPPIIPQQSLNKALSTPVKQLWNTTKVDDLHAHLVIAGSIRFPFNSFKHFWPSFQSSFHLSSLYFFAIGLPKMFSFRWDLPPFLGCNPKQPDSSKGWHVMEQYLGHGRDSHPLWCLIPKNLYPKEWKYCPRDNRSKNYNSKNLKTLWFKIWAMSTSLSVTKDILVSFISSA